MLKLLLTKLLLIYRSCISPLVPNCCIHKKTCSKYALQCLRLYPVYKALPMIVLRIISCHPFNSKDRRIR